MTPEYKTICVETCGNGSQLCFDREHFLLGHTEWNAQRNQFEYTAQYATVYTTERLVEIASCLLQLQRERKAQQEHVNTDSAKTPTGALPVKNNTFSQGVSQ